MLNKINLQGRLTKDPELRYTTNGKAVAVYTVAVERDYQPGGTERLTDFINCVSWNQGGEFVSRNFHKGQLIVLSGRLQSRKWTDRDGNNRTDWEVVTDNVYFGGDKRAEKPQLYEIAGDGEEDLPF